MKENIFNEILTRVGADFELKERIKYWIEKIEKSGVTVLTRSDNYAASYENGIIRISTHHKSSTGERVLWDLAHEYGHHLDDDKTGIRTTPRELRAWEIAKSLLKEDPIYNKYKESFENHMNNCLLKYRQDDLKEMQNKKCKVVLMNGTFLEGELINVNVVLRTFIFQEKGFERKSYPTDNVKQVNPIPSISRKM